MQQKQQTQKLYFIAIVPSEPVYSFAQQQKEYFAKAYNSKAALRSPPHITLHMPFQYKEHKEEKIIQALELLSKEHRSFSLDIDGFGAFEPRVIYLTVEKTNEIARLQHAVGETMKTQLNLFNANYKDQVFRPHLTVAFRDLRKQKFTEAWQEFKDKSYRQSIDIHTFSLLKHNGKAWEIHREFGLALK